MIGRTILIAAIAATLATTSEAKERPEAARGQMTKECTHHVTPADTDKLFQLQQELPEGAVLCLAPGVYSHVIFWIERSITIRGTARDEVIVDADRIGPVAQIANNEKSDVVIESLTLRNGWAGNGVAGILEVHRARTVLVRDVAMIGGTSDSGGAVKIAEARVTLERCLITGNDGTKQGVAQAIFAFDVAKVKIRDCLIVGNMGNGPAVTAAWAARVEIENSTILTDGTAALRAVGTGSQAPILEVRNSIIGDNPIEVFHAPPGPRPQVLLEHNAMARAPKGEGFVAKDNVIGPLALDPHHHPLPGSPATGYGATWK